MVKAKDLDLDSIPHPTLSYSYQFALDVLLREHGFRIWWRIKNSPAIWEKNRAYFKQLEALSQVPRKEIQEALSKERAYLDERFGNE